MKSILVIEDDTAIAELERDYLEMADFRVDIETNGSAGLMLALKGGYALIIVDLMLPGADGFRICRELRAQGETPIIVVSAKSADIDKIRALGLGADDYVVKPFSPAELVARAKAHMDRYERLRGGSGALIVSVDDIVIDIERRTIHRGEAEITVTATEWTILQFLALDPGRIRTRDEIFDHLHGAGAYGDLNAVAVHMRRLREKLEHDPANPRIVETVWGMGYRLKT